MADQQPDVPQEFPPFVTNEADRARWKNAGQVARNALGDMATEEAVWQVQRTIYHDRETYKD